MLGLALEGGGAKGAYEIGAYRALTELGYHFDVICGVSIGAINAALLAQGDCEKAAEFWETTANDDLFSEEDKGFLEIINRQVNLNTLSALKENIKAALENGGIDTSKIRAFLEQNIDPQRLLGVFENGPCFRIRHADRHGRRAQRVQLADSAQQHGYAGAEAFVLAEDPNRQDRPKVIFHV